MIISISLGAFPLWMQSTVILVFLCVALLHGLLGIMHAFKQGGFLQTHPTHKRAVQRTPKRRRASRSSSVKIPN